MVAKKGEIDIGLENETPRMEGSNLDTGEGRTTAASTCSKNEAGVLKPQGGTLADDATTERTVVSHRNLREVMRIGTWNVRSMERTGVHMMGVSEMKWTGMGHFKTDDYEVYYCGQDTRRRNGVAFICTDELKRCVLGFNTISDRVITIRLQCKQVNMTVIQIYAPTATAEDEEIEHFYEMVQKVVDETPKGMCCT